MRNLFVALFTLTSSVALAQTAEPQPGTGDATTPATEASPAPEAPASSDAPAQPSIDERMTTTEGKVTSLEEQNTETKSDLSALKKLKLSGYVQARYQYQESLDDTGAGSFSRFGVRRGRLKTTYTTDWAQLMLQFDAVPDTAEDPHDNLLTVQLQARC